MIGLWILAAALSAAAAVLVLSRARRAAREIEADDPHRLVHQRQLAEIDDLAARGLLREEEHKAARAEAARRLLADAARRDVQRDDGMAGSGRRTVLAVALAAPLLALATYLAVGSPNLPDQPFRQRLAAWKAAEPSSLGPAEMAALLTEVARERPSDATPLIYLAQAQAMAGADARVLITLREAARREPRRPDVWILLGQAEVAAAEGEVTAPARAAFEQAARLAPRAPEPRYFLARARIATGDVEGGLAAWEQLAASLPAGSAERTQLTAEISRVRAAGRLSAPAPAQAAQSAVQGEAQRRFIQGMVDSLAARLSADPDDPAGWARLIRSYGVLDQPDRRRDAIAQVRARYGGRPDLSAAIIAGDEAKARELAR